MSPFNILGQQPSPEGETGWFLDAEKTKKRDCSDNGELTCPSHWLPHSLPILQPRIKKEPCHFHEGWRNFHHDPFCYIFCPNYKHMVASRERYLEEQS